MELRRLIGAHEDAAGAIGEGDLGRAWPARLENAAGGRSAGRGDRRDGTQLRAHGFSSGEIAAPRKIPVTVCDSFGHGRARQAADKNRFVAEPQRPSSSERFLRGVGDGNDLYVRGERELLVRIASRLPRNEPRAFLVLKNEPKGAPALPEREPAEIIRRCTERGGHCLEGVIRGARRAVAFEQSEARLLARGILTLEPLHAADALCEGHDVERHERRRRLAFRHGLVLAMRDVAADFGDPDVNVGLGGHAFFQQVAQEAGHPEIGNFAVGRAEAIGQFVGVNTEKIEA